MVDLAGMGLVGLALDAAQRAAFALRRRKLFSDGWLEGRLIARGFDPGEVRAHVSRCANELRDLCLLDERAVERFLDDDDARTEIERLYQTELRRTSTPLDPLGFCMWGGRLHRSGWWSRPFMREHLARRIRSFAGEPNAV